MLSEFSLQIDTDTSILPLMCLAYMVQALDKGVIGPASIMGWLPDIGAKGQDYALTSTVLWAGIIAGEPLVSDSLCRAG